ncbi:MAG: endopeptidase La [Myxococcota bacterium]
MSKAQTTTIEIGGERVEVPVRVPVLPVRNTVIFPGVTLPLSVGRPASLAAVQQAAKSGGFLAVVTQRAPDTETPRLEDLYPVGTLAKIVHLADTGSGLSVVAVGLARVRLRDLAESGQFLEADTEILPDLLDRTPEAEAARRTVQRLGKELVALRDDIPDEAAQILDRFDDPARLADVIAFNGTMPLAEKIELLSQQDVLARLRTLMRYLMREIRIAQVSKTFAERAAGEIGDVERRKLLREQLRKIRAELGETDEQAAEGDELRARLEEADLPDDVREVAEREVNRLAGMPSHSPERSVARSYVEWLLDLPWKAETEDNLDLANARRILDEDHYDLEKVKERVLEYLAVRHLIPDPKGPILCFVGPPGVGKTSLGKSIARAMGRKFVRCSLGGVRDEAEIRGHRRTYVAALPGRVLQNLRSAGTRNPVFILDEIDKVGMDYRGDPSSALLEVLDPEQNSSFSDHYVELPFDLSRVLFIATANRIDTIPAPLLDRMEIIELPGYTAREKLRIGRDHLLPRQLAEHGLAPDSIALSDEVLLRLIEGYTREAGVRSLERQVASLVRKCALSIAEGKGAPVIGSADLAKLLGPAQFTQEVAERSDRPGVATGMVWTPVGGDIVFVEAARMEGKPELNLTGQMGDVMRESAEAALSYVRTNAEALGIEPDVFEKTKIHVHVPAGGTPKDGPSAGITMIVALASLLSGKPVRGDLAMTGEITLRGQVLPVGGIKGKVLAAHRAGIKELILPTRNAKDLEDVPPEVLSAFKIHLVDQSIDAVREAIPGIGR